MTDSLILIPARSGSTRVKNKNIRALGNKPLLGHIVSAARKSQIGRVVVSTDSEEIASVAQDFGAETPFLRPQEHSGSDSPSIWVILYALKWFLENENWIPDIVAFCPPTNPFTSPDTIAQMKEKLLSRPEANSIVTVTQAQTHPFRIVLRGNKDFLTVGSISLDGKTTHDIEMTQDWPKALEGSPACRMTRSQYFLDLLKNAPSLESISGKTYDVNSAIGYEIDQAEALDIDGEDDWMLADFWMTKKEA